LLEARHRAPAEDTALVHTIRMALRNQLQSAGGFGALPTTQLSEPDSQAIAEVALGVKSAEAGSFILKHVQKISEPRELLMSYLRHAARHAPRTELDELPSIANRKFGDDLDTQFLLFKSAQDGLAQRGAGLSAALRDWAANLAEQLIAQVDESKTPWAAFSLAEAAASANPWTLEKRRSADGDASALFLSSLPASETLTGLLRSRPFTIPPKLGFFLAGHDGRPDLPLRKKNFVRLVTADSREVLAKTDPPRNDTAQRVVWDLSNHAGKRGVLEIVDGNTGDGYAWLAAGRFDPAVVPLPAIIPNPHGLRQQNAAELVRSVPLPAMADSMASLFEDGSNSFEVRAAAASALVALNQQAYTPLLARNLDNTNHPALFREKVGAVLAEVNAPLAREAVLRTLVAAPFRGQVKLAHSLAGNAAGAEALLNLAEARKLSGQLLLDRQVRDRLIAAKLPRFKERYEKLTAGLAPVSAELQKLIQARQTGFDPGQASAERGAVVFEMNCAVCHQMGGKGAVVGPQLDGVGTRGLERLIEDVLDSNRNVDPAFRASNITLKDDTAFTGLLRREEGEVFVFADTTGKEISVRKSEIAERRESELSLMPSNFGELFSAGEFNDLMVFLLSPAGN
jgi:putative heme-binding domain-containing protein